MKTRYYLLGVVSVAFVVLALLPTPAQAQQTDFTVVKECNPNPVQIGGQLTCTIDVEPADPSTAVAILVRDTLPTGVTVTGATQQQFRNGVVVDTVPCTVTGNTVECPIGAVQGEEAQLGDASLRVTIDAIAEQCGTFTNMAEAVEFGGGTVTDTEDITVEGCQEEAGGDGTGGGAAPITQEGEQESEAGEIDQSFDVS